MFRDKNGYLLWGTNTWHTNQIANDLKAGDTVTFKLSFTCTLGPGSYSISPTLHSSYLHTANNYAWIDNLLVFDVINTSYPTFLGSNWLDARFTITH
jgi:lipopolysaccharide transport system ATP-binding protein